MLYVIDSLIYFGANLRPRLHDWIQMLLLYMIATFIMKCEVVGVLVLVGLISTIKLSSSLSCCNTYVILTDATYSQTVQGDNCVCYSTLSKLTKLASNTEKDVEVLFQPGVHTVKPVTDKLLLSVNNISGLLVRGDHRTNTTIKCLQFYIYLFKNDMNVKIQDIRIEKCTLNFASNIFTGERFKIEFVYSSLNDSGILFSNTPTSVLIQDTVIANYSLSSPLNNLASQAILDFNKLVYWPLSIILRNLNFVYNNQSLLQLSNRIGSIDVNVTITGTNNNFAHNKNPIISLKNTYPFANTKVHFFRANVQFIKNVQVGDVIDGIPPIHVYWATVMFAHSKVVFQSNMGGIDAHGTNIVFHDNTRIHFVNNTALLNGGALSLYSKSSLIFDASTLNISLQFTRNNAQKGGAIYVEDGEDIKSVFVFHGKFTLVNMVFSNNLALFGGSNIYGGWVDWFRDKTGNITENNMILNIVNSDIASDPVRICLCEYNSPNCEITNRNITVYGNVVSLDLVAVGQRYTPVAAFVRASLDSESQTSRCDQKNWKHLSPRFARLLPSCTRVTYKFDLEGETTSVLHLQSDVNTNCNRLSDSHDVVILSKHYNLFQQLSIGVKRMSCPLGFHLDEMNGDCKCNESKTYELTCDLSRTKLNRTGKQWFGLTYQHTTPDRSPGIIVYSPCPFDYCRTDNKSLSFRLEDEDVICNFNRSGILCGGCKTNFSRVFGSSKCKICSNKAPITVVIFFGLIILGPALVISLMMLDITVAVGTINGLTFYANILQSQLSTLFTRDTSSSFSRQVISWLNLETGIERCIYDGLDEYAITWFSAIFSLYFYLIAVIVIVLSHFSSRFSTLTGKNSVQVLATLFLLSYTRLLQLTISVFSYAELTYPDGYIKRVWLVDGNVEYFKGKHIPLLLIATLYVVVTLPYTIVLLSIQFLHKISHYRVMFWVQKLKPFFDAYTGPYKANHRYWTGLLLLVRVVLLATFTSFQGSEPSVNLLAIVICAFVLVGWSCLARGVYNSSINNFLETLFLCNLGITSAAVLYNKHNTEVAVQISTIVTFITFVFIILGHALKQLLRTKYGSMMKEKILDKLSSVKRKERSSMNEMSQSTSNRNFDKGVTSTIVELKEPLLEDDC